jgi:hypothetical protein
MKRILLLVTLALVMAAMMALGVEGQAGADPTRNSHNCAGTTNSGFAPEGTRAGAWGEYISPVARDRQADEEAHVADANCSKNSVPRP